MTFADVLIAMGLRAKEMSAKRRTNRTHGMDSECNDKRMRNTCDAPQLDECAEGGTDARRMYMDTRIAVYTCIPIGTYTNAHTHTQTQDHTHTCTFETTCVDLAP